MVLKDCKKTDCNNEIDVVTWECTLAVAIAARRSYIWGNFSPAP